jgi:HEAT repeat protein
LHLAGDSDNFQIYGSVRVIRSPFDIPKSYRPAAFHPLVIERKLAPDMLDERRQLLKGALSDPDEGVRFAAAAALEHLESVLSLEQILSSLNSENRGIRIRAIYALERVDSPKVFPPLLSALKDSDADVRSAAVQVLGKKKNPKILGGLVRHLKDPHPAVRVHTAEALGNFSDRRLVPYLGALVTAKDAELVLGAVRSLGAIGAPEAEKYLIPLVKDPRPAVRREAVGALGILSLDDG